MIKQTLTEERVNRIFFSVQFINILADVIKIEHQIEMDVDFKIPQVNNFSNRIAKDASGIVFYLRTHPKFKFKNTDQDFTVDYAAEIHRLFRFLMGHDIDKLRELADSFEKLASGDETTVVQS